VRLPSRLFAVPLVCGAALAAGFFGTGRPVGKPDDAPPTAPPPGQRAEAPVSAPSQQRHPVVLDQADIMRTIEMGGRPVRELQGNVRVLHQGRVFTFELGRYDLEAGLLTCTGKVRVTEKGHSLTADEVSYDEKRGTVSARGHVHSWGDSLEAWAERGNWFNGLQQGELQVQARLLDKARKVELKAGQVDVDHQRGVYSATRAPLLTLLEKPPTTLQAKRIQWRRQDSLAVAVREVKLNREDIQATCDSMVWHDNTERMEFLQTPEITRGRQVVRGDKVEALLRSRRDLDSLWVQGGARMESPADSVSLRLRDQLSGAWMEMDFHAGQLISVFVSGQARSINFLKDEDGRPGMNVADAARMWITLKDQKLDTVRMGGGMEARWVPLAEPPVQAAGSGATP